MSGRADRHPTITAHMATYISVRRHELGLSLEQVAKRCGSSKAHIWALERRQSKNPTLWLILALCDALNCSLNSLIGADVSQPMLSEQEMALIDAHRRIFKAHTTVEKQVASNHVNSGPFRQITVDEWLGLGSDLNPLCDWHEGIGYVIYDDIAKEQYLAKVATPTN